MAAGSQMGEINLVASQHNLSVCSAGGTTVGIGGYLTGGGHSALSATHGLAADHVLELQVVLPSGDLVTANECQHQDLFWAMRGGGGSTFGIITSVTIAAFPSVPHITVTALVGTSPNTETYWDGIAYILTQFPRLSDLGISAYTYILPSVTYQDILVGGFEAIFSIPQLSKDNTTASLLAALSPISDHLNTVYPGEFQTTYNATKWPSFYDWWIENNGPNNAGLDMLVGSRLLGKAALTNIASLKNAIKTASPLHGGGSAYLVGGKGVKTVVPRGGSDAVVPAWRDALVHFGMHCPFSLFCGINDS